MAELSVSMKFWKCEISCGHAPMMSSRKHDGLSVHLANASRAHSLMYMSAYDGA